METTEDFPIRGCYSFRIWLWSWPVGVTYTGLPGEGALSFIRATYAKVMFEFKGVAVSEHSYRCYSCAADQLERNVCYTAKKLAWNFHLDMQKKYPYLFRSSIELPPY
ncbi:hypothetical protein [Cesiribacter sp. SM1]|uniref:hypothetical protein n=1 Tax=Cesiribacter sp. SM1 TaxID=2861196 RepID=UPI001CD4A721|nr:hypothetical protein [Cesiribacter sp. SM1]